MDLLAASRRHSRGIDLAILIGWIVVLAAGRAGASLESDPLWQIRAGQELLDGGRLVHPDTWSWAPVAGDVHPNSPAWNVVLAWAWGAGGFRGVFLLGIAIADRWAGPARVLPWWWTAVVLAGSGFLLSWSGNWLHTSWGTLSVALAGAWAVLWLLAPGLSRPVRLTAIVAGAGGLALGTLAGPYGLGIVERSRVVSGASLGLVKEWIPAFDGHNARSWLVPALIVLAVCVASAVHVVRHRSEPLPGIALQGALVVVALPAAVGGVLVAIRFTAIAWLLAAPAVGVLVMRLLNARREQVLRVVLGVSGLVLVPVLLLVSPSGAQPPSTPALAALPQGCRLFASDVDSAAVLLLRPDVQVWIDGRMDYWGRDRIIEATVRLREPQAGEPAPPGATCALFPVRGPNAASVERAAAALDASPAWRRVADIADYAVWVGPG